MRGFRKEEGGITPVVSAVLVIALVSVGLSVYLEKVTPIYQKKNEYDHMHAVRSTMFQLQSMILSRQSGSIDVQMSPADTPIFTLTKKSSDIEIRPARWVKRFLPLDDAYVDEETPAVNHDGEGLRVRSFNAGRNRWAYLKFDITEVLADISYTGIVDAWLVVYNENMSKFNTAPWNIPEYDPSSPTYAIDNFYLSDMPLDIELWKIHDDWEEETITWGNKPAPNELAQGMGEVNEEGVNAKAWPYENHQVIKDNEAWYTWDATDFVKEKFAIRENISFLMKPVRENATQERYADFSSKEGGSEHVINENETFNPLDPDEYDSNRATGHPPSPLNRPHLVVIYENGALPGPPIVDNRDEGSDNLGAFIEGGYVKFDTDYYIFPQHTFTFESGALLQEQFGGIYDLMISDPGMVVGQYNEGDEAITVIINRYRIVSWDDINTSSTVKLNVKITENTDFKVEPTDENGDGVVDPNRENLLITIRSDHEWPWKRYLRDVTMKWNQSANLGGLSWWANYYWDNVENSWGVWSNNVADFQAKQFVPRNIRLYIWGIVEDPAVRDIYYFDTTYDVEVTIGV